MAQVQCQIQPPGVHEGPLAKVEEANLTVGRPFLLVCDGEWPDLNLTSLELRLSEEDKYKLNLLKIEKKSGSSYELLVTSHKAGAIEVKAAQLIAGETSVVLSDLKFEVQSVLKEEQQPPQEPYGPMGPLVLGYPYWIWIALVLVVASIAAFVFFKVKSRIQRRKWLEDMRLHDSALTPIAQLGKSLRIAQRNLVMTTEFLHHLERDYKFFLARQYEIPTFQLKNNRILKDLKRHHRDVYDNFREEIQKIFAELERAHLNLSKMQPRDFEQLIQILRRNAEALQQWQEKRGAS